LRSENLYSGIKMTDSKEALNWMAKVDRRSVVDRRQFSYTAHIPERRCGKDRRIKKCRGRTYLPAIEDNGTMRAEEVRLKKN
jgi:hypothetical protein